MEKYFVYLEQLRQSGRINMFGAIPYLQMKFPELDPAPAKVESTDRVLCSTRLKDSIYTALWAGDDGLDQIEQPAALPLPECCWTRKSPAWTLA